MVFTKTPLDYAHMDEERIIPLLKKLNKLPWIHTYQSCEGHLEFDSQSEYLYDGHPRHYSSYHHSDDGHNKAHLSHKDNGFSKYLRNDTQTSLKDDGHHGYDLQEMLKRQYPPTSPSKIIKAKILPKGGFLLAEKEIEKKFGDLRRIIFSNKGDKSTHDISKGKMRYLADDEVIFKPGYIDFLLDTENISAMDFYMDLQEHAKGKALLVGPSPHYANIPEIQGNIFTLACTIDDIVGTDVPVDDHFHPAGYVVNYANGLCRFNEWNETLFDLDTLVTGYLHEKK